MAQRRPDPRSGDDWCVVGLTPATTADGRPHLDGSACAITADRVVAVAEERVSRRYHQGGSELALRAVLAAVGRTPAQVNRWALSTCGESIAGSPATRSLGSSLGASLADLGVAEDRVGWVPSHHLSHALTAALHGEPNDIVFVADDAGTDLGPAEGVERATSYRIGADGALMVLDRVATHSDGLGTAYRLATERLGFDGYTECGKAMALAAFDRSEPRLPNPPVHPMLEPVGVLDGVERLVAGGGRIRWRHGTRMWHDGHVAAARLAQCVLERGLLDWVDTVIRHADVSPTRIIWAGGVALNCRAIGLVADQHPDLEVLVAPAPGDSGQALGNAIHAARDLGLKPPPEVKSLFLGPDPHVVGVDRLASTMGVPLLGSEEQTIAMLEAGHPVAIFYERSEFGPRALGHRSILADPRQVTMVGHLNRMKGREPFRPFGLVAFQDVATRLVGGPVVSPAMLVARHVIEPEAVPATVHVDGTCRLQTVARSSRTGLAALLHAWEERTGLGALLNTSLNAGGQPIVEHHADGLATASNLGLRIFMPDSQAVGRS